MTIDWRGLLDAGLSQFSIKLSEIQRQQLAAYLRLLDRWNGRMNLTGLQSSERVRRLILEPLWAGLQLTPSGCYCDIGSGNGSPAVPWAVLTQFDSWMLIESRRRRAVFLEVLLRELDSGTGRGRVYCGRFEAVASALPPPNWVTLQGVRLDDFLLECIRKLNPEARIVWFARNAVLREDPEMCLEVPLSDRQVFVFGPRAGTPSGHGQREDRD